MCHPGYLRDGHVYIDEPRPDDGSGTVREQVNEDGTGNRFGDGADARLTYGLV